MFYLYGIESLQPSSLQKNKECDKIKAIKWKGEGSENTAL